MKNCLTVILAASLFISCNSGKVKTVDTEDSPAVDSMIPTPRVSIEQPAIVDSTPVSSNRLIVPGKSIGLSSIDEKHSEADKHLGPPSTQDAAMGKELSTWYSKRVIHSKDTITNETDIFFTTNMGGPDEASRISHIRITSAFFMTPDHIGIGRDLGAILKYFPGSEKIASYTSPKTKKKVIIYDDRQSGIAFEIDEKNVCVAITVHKPGKEAYETYNALFENVKYF